MPTLCLTMIVRNEAPVIERCLRSVLPLLDSWCIVDTGSTDGTQEIVRSTLGHLPGELYERAWVDFSSNRNEALLLAERLDRPACDYALTIDADDTLVSGPGFFKESIVSDAHSIRIDYQELTYWRTMLFRLGKGYHYEGVLHEYLVSDSPVKLPGLHYKVGHAGSRSTDPDKYRRDAEVLEQELLKEPYHPRNLFYLAQSYRDAGETAKAILAYRKRASMTQGFEEEAYISLYQAAKLEAACGGTDVEVVNGFLVAYERRPTRAEPLWQIAKTLRERGRIKAAYPFASGAYALPRPVEDLLFVEEEVYAWRAADELAVSAYWIGRYPEAFALNEFLLSAGVVPEGEDRKRIEKNLDFSREKLKL